MSPATIVTDMSQYRRSVFLIIAGGLFLSTSGLAVRSLEQADGLQIVFYRSVGLSIFMALVVMLRTQRGDNVGLKKMGGLGLLAGLLFAGASIAIIYALLNTSVANAVFIISLAPFFAAIAGWVFLRERVPVITWLAMGLAILGVMVMVEGGVNADGLLGIACAFAMAVCYGLFSVCIRAGRDRDMLPAVLFSGIILALFTAVSTDSLSLPPTEIAICVAMGAFQLGMGSLCITLGAQHVPAAQITLLAMLEVVLNPFWVWLSVGETPGLFTLLGGALILAAISIQTLGNTQDETTRT